MTASYTKYNPSGLKPEEGWIYETGLKMRHGNDTWKAAVYHTDKILLAIAPPEQIAALTSYSDDPGLSAMSEAARLFRGEAMNLKFIDGMKRHGYEGASDLANYLAHSYQWDATSGVMKDWMYEGYARKYVLDAGMQEDNPWALHRVYNLSQDIVYGIQETAWILYGDEFKQSRHEFLTAVE